MTKKNIVLITLIFMCVAIAIGNVFGQNDGQHQIDSLQRWLSQNKEANKARAENLISLEFLYFSHDASKVGSLSEECLQISKGIDYRRGVSFSYNFLATKAYNEGNYKKAIEIGLRRLEYTEKKQYLLHQGDAMSFLGRVYFSDLKDITKGMDYYQRAYDLISDDKAKNKMSAEALINARVAAANNLSDAYSQLKQFDKALKLNLEALSIEKTRKEKNPMSEFVLLLNIGVTYFEKKKYDLALKYMLRSLEKAKKYGITYGLGNIYTNIGETYMMQKKYKEAKEYLTKPIIYNDKKEELEHFKMLHKLYFNMEEYEKAYDNVMKYNLMKDSLQIQEQNRVTSELSTKYETNKKKQQIILLEKDKILNAKSQQLYVIIMIGLAILLFICIVFIWRIRIAKQKAETANFQRDKLFSIVAHDLKSPVASLQHVTGSLKMVLKRNDLSQLELLGSAIEKSAVNLYQLVDNLLNWTLSHYGGIKQSPQSFNCVPEIAETIDIFEVSAAIKGIELSYIIESPNHYMIYADRHSFKTIIRNLVDNAIKFTKKKGKITVELNHFENKAIIKVRDNGVGISNSLASKLFKNDISQSSTGTHGEKGTGMGLFVCKELAIINKSTLYLEESSSLGSVFVLEIPLAETQTI